jgi:phosphoglycolate phosphatase-like HAD superfamily hydrolase
MIRNIIFDYDGTIADSVDIKTKAFAELYSSYGEEVGKNVVKYHLAHGGVSRFDKLKFFHKEFLNIDLNNHKLQQLAQNFSKLVIDKVVNAPYIAGAFEFISNNSEKYNLFISTATPTNEIIKILNRKNLIQFFKDIKGSPESKIDHVKHIISKNNYLRKETVFIGDSESDKEAAVQNNLYFIQISKEEIDSLGENSMPNLKNISTMINLLNRKNKRL